jgi:predicted DNA-binding transcriptional regulator AlpA
MIPNLRKTDQTEGNGQADPTPCALLWSIDDLARAMGISRRTLERLEAGGAIGPVRVKLPGRMVRFLADECRVWIAAHCPPRDEWRGRNGQDNRRQASKSHEK